MRGLDKRVIGFIKDIPTKSVCGRASRLEGRVTVIYITIQFSQIGDGMHT